MSILRAIFGPSKEEIWRQLCAEINADYIEGGFFKGPDKVELNHREWTITLDSYTVSGGDDSSDTDYTRFRAPYVNRDGFRFTIYTSSIFSGLGKLLGMQDIDVGFPVFDENFVIKGNDEEKVRQLFQNKKIRRYLSAQPRFRMQVKDDEGWFSGRFPEGVDELCFDIPELIKEVDWLEDLFELFATVLDQLCIIGSAYENDPGVELK